MNTISRLADWQTDYRQLGCGRFVAWYDIFGSSSIRLTSQYCNREMLASGTPPVGHTALLLPLASNTAGIFNGSELTGNDAALFNADSETNYRTPADLRLMTVTIPTSKLIASINSLDGGEEGEGLVSGLRRTSLAPSVVTEIQAAFRHLLQIARSAEGATKLDLPLLETEEMLIGMLTRLLTGPGRSKDTRARRNHLHYVRRARDYIDANLVKPLYLQNVAEASGTSQRTLETAFQKILGLTPGQYIKNRRLTAAKQRLLHPNSHTTTVSAVARSYGFNHMGHFGQDYCALFDELPTQTLTAARRHQA